MAQQNSIPYNSDLNLGESARRNAKATPWKLWLRRHRTRKQLKALLLDDPERLLRDLGLHPAAVRTECQKWFWQA